MRRAVACLAMALLRLLAAPTARAGETACRLEEGAVVATAAYGDIAGDFIVDLSAPRSQLHLTVARAHGLEGGSARAPLRLAGDSLAGFSMEIADLDARSAGFLTNIAGVLGADIAAGRVVSISQAPCRITIGEREGTRVPRASRLELHWIAGVPAVRASVCDSLRCESGLFAIDTASQGVRVAGAALSRASKGVDADSRADPPARLRALEFSGRLFEQTPAGLMADAPPGLAGAIGNQVLSRFRLTLDEPRGWLDLAPP